MADSPKPHTVQRRNVAPATSAAPAPAKKPVEARPTCKLDKNELLGLVGNMRSITADPDAEPEVEIAAISESSSIPLSKPVTSPIPIEKKLVRTVARRRTPIVGMAPISATPVEVKPAPVAKPAGSDEFVDLFAEGSDPTIDVKSSTAAPVVASGVAALSSALEPPAEPPAPAAEPIAEPIAAQVSASPVAAVVDAEIEMPDADVRPSGPITIDGNLPGSGGAFAAEPAPAVQPEPALPQEPIAAVVETPVVAAAPAPALPPQVPVAIATVVPRPAAQPDPALTRKRPMRPVLVANNRTVLMITAAIAALVVIILLVAAL